MDQLSLCLLPPPFCVQSNISSVRQLIWTDVHRGCRDSSSRHFTGVPNTLPMTWNLLHPTAAGVDEILLCYIKTCPLSCIITAFNELNYKWSGTPSNKQTVRPNANTGKQSCFFFQSTQMYSSLEPFKRFHPHSGTWTIATGLFELHNVSPLIQEASSVQNCQNWWACQHYTEMEPSDILAPSSLHF